MRFTSTSEKDPSFATFDEETKSTRGRWCCRLSRKNERISMYLNWQFVLPFANEKEKLKETHQLYNFIEKSQSDAFVASRLSPDFEVVHFDSNHREGRNASTTIGCLEKGMLVWRINWKQPCPVKKSIDLCYGRRQKKISRETSLIRRLLRRQN
ncbi:hypothetical protein L3X38_011425 [Prunus dulcis]|uniref:Uncharacterized protein n=1 Tax=Prunus dulcis TaxID=3755 RepID=A0AAD4WJ22_PRUDU|nr:hypothetical protein L3X38_011405 [Prunus dulcis]KAI5343549.1 hypothetical protein L3X38_011425 [Prunus dulcis]